MSFAEIQNEIREGKAPKRIRKGRRFKSYDEMLKAWQVRRQMRGTENG